MSSEMIINNEFVEENGMADLTLVIEDHKIPVSKAVLCIVSPVFRAMLEGDFQEKTKTELPLPGKNYEDFAEFLRCIYPDWRENVTVKNAYEILPLAHEYQVAKIQKRCELIICQNVRESHANDVPELYRHIQMAETFALDELVDICTCLVSEHKLDDFEKALKRFPISNECHLKVIKLALRRLELHIEDEEIFDVDISEDGYSTDGIDVTLTGSFSNDNGNVRDSLRALRLYKRFNCTRNNFRSKIMKRLKARKDWTEDLKEEFKLLPEEIKKMEAKSK